jgi:hypothetical protein
MAICIGIVLTICVTISIFPSQTIDKFNAAVTNATQFVVKRSSSSLKSPLPEPKNGCFLAVSIATFQKINRSLAVPDGCFLFRYEIQNGSYGRT